VQKEYNTASVAACDADICAGATEAIVPASRLMETIFKTPSPFERFDARSFYPFSKLAKYSHPTFSIPSGHLNYDRPRNVAAVIVFLSDRCPDLAPDSCRLMHKSRSEIDYEKRGFVSSVR
jgi:hypothetical protein